MQSHPTPASVPGQHPLCVNSEKFRIPENGVILFIVAPSAKKSKEDKPSEVFFKMASRLREAVLKTSFFKQFSLKDWAREFELLSRMLGGDHDRINQALEWFHANIRDTFCPRVRSAKSFRQRFDSIEYAASRRPMNVPLTGEAAEIVKTLLTYYWPKDTESQLAGAVKQSVKNLRSWLREHGNNADVQAVIGEVTHYLEQWFRSVRRQYKDWADWNGDLGPHVWTPDHRWFTDAYAGYLKSIGA